MDRKSLFFLLGCVFLLTSLVGCSKGAPTPDPDPSPQSSSSSSGETETPKDLQGSSTSTKEVEEPQPYNYNWEVNDGESKNYFGQEQSANEAGRVEGKYYVWLADGRLMTVSYYVDGESGFVPTITFSDPNFNPPPADAPPKPT